MPLTMDEVEAVVRAWPSRRQALPPSVLSAYRAWFDSLANDENGDFMAPAGLVTRATRCRYLVALREPPLAT